MAVKPDAISARAGLLRRSLKQRDEAVVQLPEPRQGSMASGCRDSG
jgi:hypothetical protein